MKELTSGNSVTSDQAVGQNVEKNKIFSEAAYPTQIEEKIENYRNLIFYVSRR